MRRVAEDNGVVFTVETNLTNEENFRLLEEVGHGISSALTHAIHIFMTAVFPVKCWKEIQNRKSFGITTSRTRGPRISISGVPPQNVGTGGADLEPGPHGSGQRFQRLGILETYYFARPLNDGDFVGLAKEDCKRLRNLFSR